MLTQSAQTNIRIMTEEDAAAWAGVRPTPNGGKPMIADGLKLSLPPGRAKSYGSDRETVDAVLVFGGGDDDDGVAVQLFATWPNGDTDVVACWDFSGADERVAYELAKFVSTACLSAVELELLHWLGGRL